MKKIFVRSLVGVFILGATLYLVLALGLMVMSKMAKVEESSIESTVGHFKSPHRWTLLDSGVDSLSQRVSLIRSAQKTIEMEFFIFDLDQTSRVLMVELIKRAEAGVKVRMIVDFSKPIFKLGPAYAKYLEQFGIDVRYYNTAPLYQVVSIQHRTHRKILTVDDRVAIVGGRNIADEYFDMDPNYNFIDSDVLVQGEVAAFIRKSFDAYFESRIVHKPNFDEMTENNYLLTKKFFEDKEAFNQTLQKMESVAHQGLESFDCQDVTFLTDPPTMNSESRVIFNELAKFSEFIETDLYIESPYFVLEKGGADLLRNLKKKGVQIRVLTNNLYSTDATYVVSAVVNRVRTINDLGLTVHLMTGKPVANQSLLSQKTRWGLHAKRAVADQKHVFIGTYNFDPRSANLNSELMIICKDNPELARAVLKNSENRLAQSQLWLEGGEIQNFSSLFGEASWATALYMAVLLPVADLFAFLL